MGVADRRLQNNRDIAELLRDVGVAYGIKGRNAFEARAYAKAAHGVADSIRDVRSHAAEGSLREISGVGATIAKYLDELYRTGAVPHFDEVFAGIPDAVFELLAIPGVGATTAQKLAAAGVEDLRDLELKLARSELRGAGFTPKALEKIAAGLAELQRRSGRMLLPQAEAVAAEVVAYLRPANAIERVEIAGSLRRRCETIGDINLVVATRDPAAGAAALLEYPGRAEIRRKSAVELQIALHNGAMLSAAFVAPGVFGAALLHLTGSEQHYRQLAALAAERGATLAPRDLQDKTGITGLEDEANIYRALGAAFVPPELREDRGEIAAALAGDLPALIGLGDLRGDCHSHTAWSDGRDSAVQMTVAARALGHEYLAITDHSYPSLNFVARSREIDALRASDPGLRLIDGLEVNITSEGGLQVADDILAAHEYCIGSIHSSFRQPRDVMTARLLAALAHPSINGIAHPSGRLLNAREGIDADWDAVMEACLHHDKFLEIDGWPDRLDLADVLVQAAVRRGVKLIIDSDAHASEQLAMQRYGIDVARRGWATAAQVLNTLPFTEFVREAHVRLRDGGADL